jgi:hypothetical protein
MQGYTMDQYNDEIRNLQTSTSQWYLSLLKEPPEQSDSDSNGSPEGPQPLHETCTGLQDKCRGQHMVDGLVCMSCKLDA